MKIRNIFIPVVITNLMFFSSCSYENLVRFKLFHHIEYNKDAYYILDDSSKIPEEYIPFDEEILEVILVDENGKAYDEDKTEEARTYRNDKERIFIFYGSDPYTKDISLVDEHLLN